MLRSTSTGRDRKPRAGIRRLSTNPARPRAIARGVQMQTMDMMFEEREVVEEAADKWWLFLLTGIAWLVFALLVFQWDYTTVAAISYLFGAIAIVAGVHELFQIGVSTTGW